MQENYDQNRIYEIKVTPTQVTSSVSMIDGSVMRGLVIVYHGVDLKQFGIVAEKESLRSESKLKSDG